MNGSWQSRTRFLSSHKHPAIAEVLTLVVPEVVSSTEVLLSSFSQSFRSTITIPLFYFFELEHLSFVFALVNIILFGRLGKAQYMKRILRGHWVWHNESNRNYMYMWDIRIQKHFFIGDWVWSWYFP